MLQGLLLVGLVACGGGGDDTGAGPDVSLAYSGDFGGQTLSQATLEITDRPNGGQVVTGSAWLDYGDLQSIRLTATDHVVLDADGRVVTWTQDLVHTLGNTELRFHHEVDAAGKTAVQGIDDHGSTFTWAQDGPVVLYAYPSDGFFGLSLPTPVSGYVLSRALALGEDLVAVWPYYGLVETYPSAEVPACWFWVGDRYCMADDGYPERYSPSTLNARMSRVDPSTVAVDEVAVASPTEWVEAPDCTIPTGDRHVAFTVDSTDATIAGRLLLPSGTGPFPTLQINTGTGGGDRAFTTGRVAHWDCLAHELLGRGIAVASYDDRGHGESTGLLGQPYAARTDDVDFVAAWVRAQPSTASLYLLGHSEGVSHVSEAVGTGTAADGLVLVSGIAGHGDDAWIEQGTVYMEALGFPQAETDALAAQRQSVVDQIAAGTYPEANLGAFSVDTFWSGFFAIDGLALVDQTTQPILVVQGGSDWQVPPHNGTDFRDHLVAKQRDVTLYTDPALGHLLQPAVGAAPIGLEYFLPWAWDDGATQAIGDWLLLQESGNSR